MTLSQKQRLVIGIFLMVWILVPAISVFAEIIQYSYDDMDRLIRAEYEDGTVIVYTYDKAGNRLTKTITATSDLEILTVLPTFGPTAGGTSVTISGSGFGSTQGTGSVTFGGVAAASYTSWSDTEIVCTTPAHAAGIVDVVVMADNGLSGTKPTAFTYTDTSTFFEDFEHDGALPDGWENASGDDLDWTVYAGATPSGSTGPSVDHTLGTAAGYYVYVEASGHYPNQAAHLLSPVIDLSALTSPTLGFWYHLYGSAMGALHVDVYAGGVWHADVLPPLSGNRGDMWRAQQVDLSAYTGSIRLRFRGVTGTGSGSDLAIDDVSVFEAPPAIVTFPYLETFEQGGAVPAGWLNAAGGDVDWMVNAGATPSGSTGPSVDHTLGTAAGYYVYVEASGHYPNQAAHLVSPVIDLSALTSPTLGFWYHLYGSAMGELHVDVYADGVWHADVLPPLSGNRDDMWRAQQVDLSAYTGSIRIRFRGVTGTGSGSDLAIDDISVFEAPSAIVTFPYSETFEQGGAVPVGWLNAAGGDVDWMVNAGATPSSDTGPSVDHTLGTAAGYYVYVEASGHYPNQAAHLLSPVVNLSALTSPTLGFWYHLYGSTMGALHVDVYAGGVWLEDVMPPLKGNRGDTWREQRVDLSAYTGSIRIRFRGVTGSGYSSDMAIDDVTVFEAPPAIATFPYSETFEQAGGLPAGWLNAAGGDFDWMINAGATPNGGTGPSVDHTLGTAAGYYVYLEATGNYPYKTAQLLSPVVDLSVLTSPTLDFWYHLYGSTMGTLHVDVYAGGVWHVDVMSPLSGNHGDMWFEHQVDLSAYTGSIRIRFRGVTGAGYSGDMAIDDVSIFEPSMSSLMSSPLVTVQKEGTGDGTIRVGAQECGEGCETLQVPYADYALLTVIAAKDSHFVRLEREDGTPLNVDSFEVSPGETVFVIFERNE